jgi:hypothetical protein
MNFFEHLQGLFSSRIDIAKGIWTLIKLEARLAGLAIFPLLINIGLLIALILTTWSAVLLLVGYFITLAFNGSVLLGMISVLILNSITLLLVFKRLSTSIRDMSFEKTRACLAGNNLRDAYEPPEQTTGIDSRSRLTRKKRANQVNEA